MNFICKRKRTRKRMVGRCSTLRGNVEQGQARQSMLELEYCTYCTAPSKSDFAVGRLSVGNGERMIYDL